MDPAVLRDWQQAAGHFAAGQYADAAAVLRTLLERDPGNAQASLALAQVGIRTGSPRETFRHASNAARDAADEPGLLCDIATALLTVGAAVPARECVERAAAAEPAAPMLQQRIAMHWQNLNEHDTALAWMKRARADGLDDLPARFCLAVQLIFHGRMCEAEVELEACQEAIPPLGRAMVQLAQVRQQTAASNHLESLRDQLTRVSPGSEDAAALEFARYKEFEDLGRHEEAWASLARANATMHALLKHDPAAEARTFESLIKYADTLPAPRSNIQTDGPVPIFIVGMPRSGTTLLDRMLGNHSQVRSAGELGTFRRSLERAADHFTGHMLDEALVERLPHVDYAELGSMYLANSAWLARGRRFYVDKLPRNWLLAPLIGRALPQARILHLVRDPMDTAFSNFRSYFGPDYPYSYDLDCLAAHFLHYREIMAHWRRLLPDVLLDVSYARLVSEPESELRRVFEFCGLAWQAGCSDLERNDAPVATLSATQVRGGVREGFSHRWPRYGDHLTALRARIDANTVAADAAPPQHQD